ncbi:hypothetical protein QE152_g11275 [Popillia japonica]|uniref:Uncharacterized protein n=1 Tax=Popillia japonica TaxID=7064 RepID=A0AAW1LT11_POPJA
MENKHQINGARAKVTENHWKDTTENLLGRPAIEELQSMKWENDKIKMDVSAEINSIEQGIKELSDSEVKGLYYQTI